MDFRRPKKGVEQMVEHLSYLFGHTDYYEEIRIDSEFIISYFGLSCIMIIKS
jgi:hypothetical protein